MYAIERKDEVPPGGWKYFQQETKTWFNAPSFDELLEKVRRHRLANNIPLGMEWKYEIERQICERMPAGVCKQDGQDFAGGVRLDFETVFRGTKTLADWFIHGREKVSLQESADRAAICAVCAFNVEIEGCAGCARGKIHELVNVIVGSDKFNNESYLRACSKCGCSLRAIVRLPLEIIQRNTPDELDSSLPTHCWHKKL